MSSSIISPDAAGLLLHRFVTEQIPIVAFFVTGDGSARVTIRGRVNSFTQDKGLAICTLFERDEPIPSVLEFPHELIAASLFRYSDETEVAKELPVGSGLRIEMPNGDNVTIMEIRINSN
jgi:hypothetical protein